MEKHHKEKHLKTAARPLKNKSFRTYIGRLTETPLKKEWSAIIPF